MEIISYTNPNGTNNVTANTSTKEEENNTSFVYILDEEKVDVIEEAKKAKETTQRLLDDISSVLRTGFSITELEELEELIKEIQKRIKEESNNRSGSIKDIEDMIKKLEMAVRELQKRSTGVAIKEADSESSTKNPDNLSPVILSYQKRIDDASDSINEFRKEIRISTDVDYSNDEFELREKIKNLQEEK